MQYILLRVVVEVVLRANDDNYGIKSELWSKLISTVLLVGLSHPIEIVPDIAFVLKRSLFQRDC